jgi:hypothetical protein
LAAVSGVVRATRSAGAGAALRAWVPSVATLGFGVFPALCLIAAAVLVSLVGATRPRSSGYLRVMSALMAIVGACGLASNLGAAALAATAPVNSQVGGNAARVVGALYFSAPALLAAVGAFLSLRLFRRVVRKREGDWI